MADQWDAIEKPVADDESECASCSFQTRELTAYRRGGIGFREPASWVLLCDLCAGTMAGNAEQYPSQYQGQAAMLQTICYVGNAIIAEIRKAKG